MIFFVFQLPTKIRNLREKIGDNAKNGTYIKTIWGVGYKIEKEDQFSNGINSVYDNIIADFFCRIIFYSKPDGTFTENR